MLKLKQYGSTKLSIFGMYYYTFCKNSESNFCKHYIVDIGNTGS